MATEEKKAAKLSNEQALDNVANIVKALDFLAGNTSHKPKTLTYTKKLLQQWGSSLVVKGAEKAALKEIKERYQAERKAALDKMKAEISAKMGTTPKAPVAKTPAKK